MRLEAAENRMEKNKNRGLSQEAIIDMQFKERNMIYNNKDFDKENYALKVYLQLI